MTSITARAHTLSGEEMVDTVGTAGGEAFRLAIHAGAHPEVALMVASYVTALNAADRRESQRNDQWHRARERTHLFFVEERTRRGQRYLRIVTMYQGEETTRSVHAFVEVATGHVLKSAGWKAPAQGMRYDLSDAASVEALRRALDQPGYFAGGYLYADRVATYAS